MTNSTIYVMTVTTLLMAPCVCGLQQAKAQPKGFNYDESKVPKYTLPDPLVMSAGTAVTDAKMWRTQRRPELLALFKEHVYGAMPPPMKVTAVETSDFDLEALDGKATCSEATLYFSSDRSGPKIHVLDSDAETGRRTTGRFPHFSATTLMATTRCIADETDPAEQGVGPQGGGASHAGRTSRRAGPAPRGGKSRRSYARGYALVTVYYGDVDPGLPRRIQEWSPRALSGLPESRTTTGHQSAVGHGASAGARLPGEGRPDRRHAGGRDRAFATGQDRHSGRARPTSDSRWSSPTTRAVAGRRLARRRFGETVARINTSFPHWFCTNHKKYNDNEDAMPVDQHELIALIAPRPVYVASASGRQVGRPTRRVPFVRRCRPGLPPLGHGGPSDDGVARGQPARSGPDRLPRPHRQTRRDRVRLGAIPRLRRQAFAVNAVKGNAVKGSEPLMCRASPTPLFRRQNSAIASRPRACRSLRSGR